METGTRTEDSLVMKVIQWGRRRPVIMATFFSAVIFGLVAQGMGLFNKFSHHDDIMALFSVGTTISSGRWMLHVMDWLETLIFGDGHFSLPLTHGLFSLLWVAFAASLLASLFRIRKPVYGATLGAIMAAFPTITGLFGFMFTMPYYMISMGMMMICACLICRKGSWWTKIIAIILGGCSVGTYQAFIPFLLSVPLLYDIALLFRGEEKGKSFLMRFAVQALCILGVMVFYFAVNRFFLNKFHLELNHYMGINTMTTTTLDVYLERAGKAWLAFFLPERNVSADIFPMHLYYVTRVMAAADILMATRMIFRAWRDSKGRALVLAGLFALMPLACNFIYVMSEGVHGLMTYGQTMQFVLFIWLVDELEFHRPKIRRIISGTAAVMLGLTCVMYARYDNQCYLKAAFQQQQAISWFTALAAQIKSSDGYRDDLPVAFLNQEHISDGTIYNIDELDFITLDPYAYDMTEYINSYAWRIFMERWSGFSPIEASRELYAGRTEIQDMPHYPDDGSILNLGNVIVVNF